MKTEVMEENAWFGEARGLLQQPASPHVWQLLSAHILAAHDERWFVEHALSYLQGALGRWPSELRELPQAWFDELTGRLSNAMEIQRTEGISWTSIMRGRWEYLGLARSLTLPAQAWSDPFELMEVLRRCEGLQHLKIEGGSLALRELASLRQVPSLRELDLGQTQWSMDDLRGSGPLTELWPALHTFGTSSLGRRERSLGRLAQTLETGQLTALRLNLDAPLQEPHHVLDMLSAHTPAHLDLGDMVSFASDAERRTYTHTSFEARGGTSLPRLAARGFVHGELESLVLARSAYETHEKYVIGDMVASGALRQLERLVLWQGTQDIEDLEALAGCKRLQHVNLSDMTSTPLHISPRSHSREAAQASLMELLSSAQVSSWETLGLGGALDLARGERLDQMTARLGAMSALEDLDLSDCRGSSGSLASLLRALPAAASLRHLDWSYNDLDEQDIEALGELTGLVSLRLDGCSLDDELVVQLKRVLSGSVRGVTLCLSPQLTRRGWMDFCVYACSRGFSLVGVDATKGVRDIWRDLAPYMQLRDLVVGEQEVVMKSWLPPVIEAMPSLRRLCLLSPGESASWSVSAGGKERWVKTLTGAQAHLVASAQRRAL